MSRPLLLSMVALATMTACTRTQPIAFFIPHTGPAAHIQGDATSLGVREPLKSTVSNTVTVDARLKQAALDYTTELGVCVFPGNISYSDEVRTRCLAQNDLPATVFLAGGEAQDEAFPTSARPGETKTFSHTVHLAFEQPGTYTVFGRQTTWQGARDNVSAQRVTPQPLVITVR